MANPHPHTTKQSATERLDASRNVKQEAVAREMAWVAIVVRAGLWPAWLSAPRVRQSGFPWLLHLETPAGRLVYRLAADEQLELFPNLKERPNDGAACTGDDKIARLLHLATEGWN